MAVQVGCSFLLFSKPFNNLHLAGSFVISAALWIYGRTLRGKDKESPKVPEKLRSSRETFAAWKLRASQESLSDEEGGSDSLGVGIYSPREETLQITL